LNRMLTPDMERIAHELNRRVRRTFVALKQKAPARSVAVRRAEKRDYLLEPPAMPASARLTQAPAPRAGIRTGLSYRIDDRPLDRPAFFEADLSDGQVVLTLNSQHPFFDEVYGRDGSGNGHTSRHTLELLLLAAARTEIRLRPHEQRTLRRFRKEWSDALTAF